MSSISSGDEIFYGDNIVSDSAEDENSTAIEVTRDDLEQILDALSKADAAQSSPAEAKRELLRAWMLTSRLLDKESNDE